MAKELSINSLFDSWPTEHILICDTIHVARIEFSGVGVDHVIRKDESVPLVDPICGSVITCFEISIHAEKPGQSAVCSIVERSSVESSIFAVSNEVLVRRVACHLRGLREGFGDLIWLPSTSKKYCTKVVPASDFSGEEEVVLAKSLRAFAQGCVCKAHGIRRALRGLVVPPAIHVKLSNCHAVKVLDLRSDGSVPLTQTILHGGEFGQLSSPVREDAESLRITVLVKLRVVAADHSFCHSLIHRKSGLIPEARVVASLVVCVPKLEIIVLSIRLPLNLVLVKCERRCAVEVSVEADEVAKCRKSIVQDDVHPSLMNLVNGILPYLDRPKVRIKY